MQTSDILGRGRLPNTREVRSHILQTAGQMFGEHGYAKTSVRGICAEAGVSMHAVQFHFRDKVRLYAEVLLEAQAHLISLDELHAAVNGGGNPYDKVGALIELLVDKASSPDSWGLRVLLREMIVPSNQVTVVLKEALLPKLRVLEQVVQGAIELPQGHPTVRHCLAFVVLPCLFTAIASEQASIRAVPNSKFAKADYIKDLTTFVMAGMKALKGEENGR